MIGGGDDPYGIKGGLPNNMLYADGASTMRNLSSLWPGMGGLLE